MSNVLKENYKKLVDALAPYFGGASDFDELTNRPTESDVIDISELDLPMPAKPMEYPVLFDETGTEYQVGWYKRASDGKVKPVWRKDFTDTFSSNIVSEFYRATITHGISDIDFAEITKVSSLYNAMDTTSYNGYYPLGIVSGNSSGAQNVSTGIGGWINKNTLEIMTNNSNFAGKNVNISIQYTKTTDEFRDL